MVKVPVPKAAALLISKVPAVSVVPPVKVLAAASVNVPAETATVPVVVPTIPLRINIPAPALEILSPAPEMAPPTVKVLPEAVIVGLAPRVMAPEPMFKECVPVKVKLPFQVWGLLLESVRLPAELLSIVVPDAMVKAPAAPPRAVELLIFNVPNVKVVPVV